MLFLILLTVGLILLMLLTRMLEKTWMSPGAFFSLLWCCYSFTIWLFDMSADVLAVGLLWVLASCVLVHVGCLFGRGQLVHSKNESFAVPVVDSVSLPYLKTLSLGLSGVGLIYALTIFFRNGDSLGDVISFAYLNQLVMFNRATFVYGQEKLSTTELIAFGFFYAAPLFGGLLYGIERSIWARSVSIISVLVPAVVGLLYGSRMGALFSGSFWISAFMASQVLGCVRSQGKHGNPLTKAMLAAGLFIVGIPTAVIFIRYEEGQFGSLGDFLEVAGDIFSFLPSFSISLNNEQFKFFNLMYGEITFGRLFEILTLRFGDHFAYEAIDVGYTSSNIFTIFRGLIDDFGHLGALMLTFVFGAVGGVVYSRVSHGRVALLPALVVVYAGVFTSFSFSLLSYSTPIFALFVFWLYMAAVAQPLRRLSSRES